MRVFVIVGLSLITSAAFAATRERCVGQIQNDDALKMVVYSWYHDALDRVCDGARDDVARDNCVRVHWALYKEIKAVLDSVKKYHNDTMYRSCERLMLQARDHMLKYRPKVK